MKKVILVMISSWLCLSLKANNEVLIKSLGQLPKQEIALGFYSIFLWSDFNPDRIEHVKSQDNLWTYKYSNSATNPIFIFL